MLSLRILENVFANFKNTIFLATHFFLLFCKINLVKIKNITKCVN